MSSNHTMCLRTRLHLHDNQIRPHSNTPTMPPTLDEHAIEFVHFLPDVLHAFVDEFLHERRRLLAEVVDANCLPLHRLVLPKFFLFFSFFVRLMLFVCVYACARVHVCVRARSYAPLSDGMHRKLYRPTDCLPRSTSK